MRPATLHIYAKKSYKYLICTKKRPITHVTYRKKGLIPLYTNTKKKRPITPDIFEKRPLAHYAVRKTGPATHGGDQTLDIWISRCNGMPVT